MKQTDGQIRPKWVVPIRTYILSLLGRDASPGFKLALCAKSLARDRIMKTVHYLVQTFDSGEPDISPATAANVPHAQPIHQINNLTRHRRAFGRMRRHHHRRAPAIELP